MQINKQVSLIVLAGLLWGYQGLQAFSVFSANGLGEMRVFPSGRVAALGGAGIALADSQSLNLANPAAWGAVNRTLMTIAMVADRTVIEDSDNLNPSFDAGLEGFSIAFYPGRGWAFGGGLQRVSRVSYGFYWQDTFVEHNYEESLTGKGGLNAAFFSLAHRHRGRLFLGVSARFLFGQIYRRWKVDYDDLVDTDNRSTSIFKGWQAEGGIIYRLTPRLSLGATVGGPSRLTRTLRDTTQADTSRWEEEVDWPLSLGVGVTYNLHPRILVCSDLRWVNWAGVSSVMGQKSGYQNSYRLALGGEVLPRSEKPRRYYQRVSYRLGVSFQTLYCKSANENPVNELFLTWGFGIPLPRAASRLDVVFGVGRRGSVEENNAGEKVFQLSLFLCSGERWFQRRVK